MQTLSMYTLIPTVNRALLKSAVFGSWSSGKNEGRNKAFSVVVAELIHYNCSNICT